MWEMRRRGPFPYPTARPEPPTCEPGLPRIRLCPTTRAAFWAGDFRDGVSSFWWEAKQSFEIGGNADKGLLPTEGAAGQVE